MGRRKSPEETAQNWENGAANAGPALEAGINSVTVSPGIKAIKALPKTKANFIKAIDDGTMERGLNSFSLESWKKDTIGKGIARFADGVSKAKDKFEHFAKQQFEFQTMVNAKLDKMPNVTLQDAKARMNLQFDEASKFSPTKLKR